MLTTRLRDMATTLLRRKPLATPRKLAPLLDVLEPEIKGVISDLYSEQPGKQDEAIRKLAELEDPRATPFLLDRANDRRTALKGGVITALAKTGDQSLMPFFLKKLKSRDANEQLAAMKAIYGFMDLRAVRPAIRFVKASPFASDDGLRFLAQIDHPEARKFVSRALSDPNDLNGAYLSQLKFEEGLNPSWLPTLSKLSEHDNVRIATRAVKLLGQIRNGKARDLLIKHIRDQTMPSCKTSYKAETTVPAAMGALSKFADEGTKDFLFESLQELPKVDVTDALVAIAASHPDVPWKLLALMRETNDHRTHGKIAATLAGIAEKNLLPEGAEPALIEQLAHQNPEVRTRIATALGFVGGEKARKAIYAALPEETHPDVHSAMARAMRSIGTRVSAGIAEQILRGRAGGETRPISYAYALLPLDEFRQLAAKEAPTQAEASKLLKHYDALEIITGLKKYRKQLVKGDKISAVAAADRKPVYLPEPLDLARLSEYFGEGQPATAKQAFRKMEDWLRQTQTRRVALRAMPFKK